MGLTALQVHASTLGATRSAEYRGATTAAAFADPETELSALRSACGVYDLGFCAKIRLTGDHRVRWLNGMITNNIRDLKPGNGVYAFLLTPQGRILGDLCAYNRGDSFVLDTDQAQVEKILTTFRRYIIMDKVELQDVTQDLTALGVAGPKSCEVLKSGGLEVTDLEPLAHQDVTWQGVACTMVRGDLSADAYEIWLPPSNVKQLWDALRNSGANAVGCEALDKFRVLRGIPAYGVDIQEKELPQETDQMRALNFTKGCYIGQEIVERIRSRGSVHRKLSGFILDDAAVGPGAKVVFGEKEVGEITSVASAPNGKDRKVALGYIRREAGAPGKEVEIGGAKAVVAELPFKDA